MVTLSDEQVDGIRELFKKVLAELHKLERKDLEEKFDECVAMEMAYGTTYWYQDLLDNLLWEGAKHGR